MSWTPDPSWEPLTSGTGVSTGGVWRTPDEGVVKRLIAGVEAPRHYAYWRRQAEVAATGIVAATPGLRSPECLRVDQDPGGITFWTAAVEPAEVNADELARALGRFGVSRLEDPGWFARRILRERLANDEGRGGWAPLASADALGAGLRRSCRAIWLRRMDVMAELDRLPQVVIHGDAHPVNLLGRDGDDIVAVDWEQFGVGPVGFDLGYLALSGDMPMDQLVDAYQEGAGSAWSTETVRRGAVLTAAVTVVARAAWSLSQPEPSDHLARLETLADLVAEA